ncbi:iron-containing alcohol dehydrogenase [Alkalibaculum sp. M08DMB]|uniref:Iron-containing alcohol dehydrogenase n=1 Tax=Alkalibaculum sporogenes TaxID=2655001 RepID=A0A6A7K6Z7_9FIRM|nr:sn-glycerol-1-phosphate dehydrogenase [Alkalibaculum sporogenes]MPW25122.1 iron-containing alcohol dehydrogenase [Alkalibaculum sporogenes]
MTDLNTLLNKEILCDCGKTHQVEIKEVDFEFKPEDIVHICDKHFKGKHVLIVADKHTYEQINKSIYEIMEKSDFIISILEFDDKKLIPDEKAVGTILMTTDRSICGIISIGSGTINDLSRLVGDRVKVPVVTIATAPSMDGYAAAGSSLMYKGVKKTIKGSTVTAIYGKVDVIKDCPYELIQAGFGDIIGKKTALADWVLSKHINDEYWCDATVKLVEESADLCIRDASKITHRDPIAIKNLIDALVLSGICMALVDDTRPASGSEHLVSHYMVMKAIENGDLPPSHGITVGFGTLVATVLYEYLLQCEPFKNLDNASVINDAVKKYLPRKEDVIKWLETIGLSINPKDYNLNEDLLREIVNKAGFIRERYTIFSLLHSLDVLDDAGEYLIQYFYKK